MNRFLNAIDDQLFIARPQKHDFTGSIGAHTRHVIEFYKQFLTALGTKEIDYDGRQRNPDTENNRVVAIQTILALHDEMNMLEPCLTDALRYKNDNGFPSSAGRELCYLAEHTIHHFALIRLIAESQGFDFSTMPDFGIAQSTLKFRTLQSK